MNIVNWQLIGMKLDCQQPLNLLRMPMAWFSLVAKWSICFDHSK